MSRTIIIGDVHLGKGCQIGKPGLGTALNSRIVDQSKILDWILEQGIENNIDRFILTGDVFEDVKPDISLLAIFINWAKQCKLHGIDVHIVLGNHDIRRTGSIYVSSLDIIADMANVYVYKHLKTIHTAGVSFTFLPYRDRRAWECDSIKEALGKISERLPYEVAEIPLGNKKVLIGHLALEGSIPVGDEFDDLINEIIC